MRMRYGIALVSLAVWTSSAFGQQRAIITFDPQAPMQAVPDSQDEEDDWLRLVDENNPQRKVQLIQDFLSDYPESEMTHLVLGTWWQVRRESGDHQGVIQTATQALDAYQYFIDAKMGFIDDPSRVPQVPRAMYLFHDQKLNMYRSLVEAHTALGNDDAIAEVAELALDAADAADQWYAELGLEAEEVSGLTAEDYDDRTVAIRMFFLDELLRQHEEARNVEGIIETSERMLEVEPDNVQILLTAATTMVQNPPEDPAGRRAHMERARDYAERADAGLDDFLLQAQISNAQQNAIIGQMYFTMGKANEELGDWSTALEAYEAAIDAVPDLPNYHIQMGYAAANLNDLDVALAAFTRAHVLAPDNVELRTTVENLYQAREGSLDGIEAYIESERAGLLN